MSTSNKGSHEKLIGSSIAGYFLLFIVKAVYFKLVGVFVCCLNLHRSVISSPPSNPSFFPHFTFKSLCFGPPNPAFGQEIRNEGDETGRTAWTKIRFFFSFCRFERHHKAVMPRCYIECVGEALGNQTFDVI